jgi:hypothetical protein
VDEQLKKQLIDQAGTYVIVEPRLTDSKAINASNIAGPEWTAKQVTERDLNQ